MFVSPLLDKDTRAARVVASVDNAARKWRPGSFVTAEIPLDETARRRSSLPKTALQTIKGETVVFVRTDEGFEARKVSIGRQDARLVEIAAGLSAGERIAIANTFILKADSARPRPSMRTRAQS